MSRVPRGIIPVTDDLLTILLKLPSHVNIVGSRHEPGRRLTHIYLSGEGCRNMGGWHDVPEGAESARLHHKIPLDKENPLNGLQWREKIAKIYLMLKESRS